MKQVSSAKNTTMPEKDSKRWRVSGMNRGRKEAALKAELIVVDLDGTAINRNGLIEESTLEEFEKYRKTGTGIVIATGRSPRGAVRQIEVIRPDICILSGGAHLEMDGETIADFRIDTDFAWDIIRRYEKKGCRQFVITTPDASYISEEINISDGSFELRDFQRNFDCDIIELSCNHSDEELEKSVLADDAVLEITKYSEENWRRYAHRDANKGAALEVVMRKLGIDPKKVIAFGDDYNDIPMFQKVGYSVAMKNAAADVKRHAKYECGANHEHGIAEFLRVFREDADEAERIFRIRRDTEA